MQQPQQILSLEFILIPKSSSRLETYSTYPQDAWDLLSLQLTEARRLRILKTVAQRTRHVRLVAQDVHQPHNVSACIRSAEGFGVQCIDVVTLKTKFDTSTVARGVDHWVDIKRHPSISECSDRLHAEGFLIAAAFPYGDAVTLDELPVDKPVALVFGNEHEGLHPTWREHSDVRFTIPMAGIVESLNISVCAAISLYAVTQKARKSLPAEQYYLSAEDQRDLLNRWICQQISSWELQLPLLRTKNMNR